MVNWQWIICWNNNTCRPGGPPQFCHQAIFSLFNYANIDTRDNVLYESVQVVDWRANWETSHGSFQNNWKNFGGPPNFSHAPPGLSRCRIFYSPCNPNVSIRRYKREDLFQTFPAALLSISKFWIVRALLTLITLADLRNVNDNGGGSVVGPVISIFIKKNQKWSCYFGRRLNSLSCNTVD